MTDNSAGRPAGDGSAAVTGATLRVLRGAPTADELAAVVVVLGAAAGRGGGAGVVEPSVRSQWAARPRLVRPVVIAGPGAWRASALPR